MIDPRDWFEKAKWLLDANVRPDRKDENTKLEKDVAEALKTAYELGLQDGLKKVKVDEEY